MTMEVERRQLILPMLIMAMLSFAAVVMYSPRWNAVSLYAILPMACVLSFCHHPCAIPNRYFGWFLLLWAWIVFTSTFAMDTTVAQNEVKRTLGCVVLAYIICIWGREKSVIPWLYGIFILLLIAAIYYGYTCIYMGDISALGDARMSDDTLNANTIAYYTFYALFAIYMLGVIPENPVVRSAFRWMFVGMAAVVYIVAIATASRQTPLISFPFWAILMILRYIGKESAPWQRWMVIIAGIVALICLVPMVMDIYQDSSLQLRNEAGGSDEERLALLKESIEVGAAHPWLGVGPDNFRLVSQYQLISHCTYTELWANTGLVGVCLYIGMLLTLGIQQVKSYRISHHKESLYILVFLGFYTIYQLLFVFYPHLWLIAFFMLVAAHGELFTEQRQYENIAYTYQY